jgi:hypothetical protein
MVVDLIAQCYQFVRTCNCTKTAALAAKLNYLYLWHVFDVLESTI